MPVRCRAEHGGKNKLRLTVLLDNLFYLFEIYTFDIPHFFRHCSRTRTLFAKKSLPILVTYLDFSKTSRNCFLPHK